MGGESISSITAEATASDEPRIRVLVADDHPLIRSGLQSVLAAAPDMLLVGEATNGADAQRLCRQHQPDVLLLDLSMPGPSALETVAYLRQHCPEAKVLMLTVYDDEAHVRGLVQAGVSGYLLKGESPATVVQAIRAVMGGGAWFSQAVAEKLARSVESPALTQREREVLQLIGQGRSNQQIAEDLHIAEITVRFHLRNVYDKIGVHTRAQAVRWAMQHGLGDDLS